MAGTDPNSPHPEAHEVFISYSWDSDEHTRRVLSLAHTLRANGVDAWLDKFDDPNEPWPTWCYKQVKWAHHVLVVCTATYLRRAMREEEPGSGRGATWESTILTNEIYNSTHGQKKVIPITFCEADKEYVPPFIDGYSVYNVTDVNSFRELYAKLTGQATVPPGDVGPKVIVPPRVPQTALPVGQDTARQMAPTNYPNLSDLLPGSWLIEIQNPIMSQQIILRIKVSKSLLGKRKFEAVSAIGPNPNWSASGTWEVISPSNCVTFTGVQMAPPFNPPESLEEAYTFSNVTQSIMQGVNKMGMPVTWRRR